MAKPAFGRDEHFRLLVESAEDYAIFMLDPEGRVVSWNRGAERIKQYAASEIIGQHFSRFYPVEDVRSNRPWQNLESAARNGKYKEEGWRIRKDGSRFWASVLITALRDADGELRGFAKVTRDITARREAEENARRERDLTDFFDNANVGLHWVGPDGIILRANQTELDLLGYQREEFVGRNIKEFHADPLVIEDMLTRLKGGENLQNYPARMRVRDGSIREVLVNSSGLFENGQFIRSRCFMLDVTELKRAEEKLHESEQRLRLALDTSQMGTWEWKIGTNEVSWSTGLERIHGLEPGTFSGTFKAFEQDIAPDDWDTVHHSIANSLESGEDHHIEYRIVRPDGGLRWVEGRGKVFRDDHGAPSRMIGVCADITERKRSEEKLRQSEERYRAIVESRMEMVCRFRPDGTILFVNGAYARSLHTTADALEGANIWDFVSEQERAEVRALLDQITPDAPEVTLENRVESADGPRWTLWTNRGLSFDMNDRATEIQSCGIDITHRKQTEHSLQFLAQASKSLSSLVDQARTLERVAQMAVPAFADWCAVDIVDQGGYLQRLAVAHHDPQNVRWAEEFHRRYPPDPNAPLGATHVLRTGESELMSDITDSMLVESARDDAHLQLLRDMQLKSYMCVPLSVKGKSLGVISFITAESARCYTADDLAIAEDVANRAAVAIENARLYQEAREADRRKDEFLAMLAHELRNPLAPIRSGLEVLAMEDNSDLATITLMQEQVQHLVCLVDDLLDVSRIMQGRIELRKEPIELSAVLRRSVDAVEGQIAERHQRLVVSAPEQSLWVAADPVRLVQVVQNLLHNATKYTGPGGRIELVVEANEKQLEIRVRDTGIGIEPDLLPRIFDPFVQSSRSLDRTQGGLGIGLTLAKRLVELHDGRISAESGGAGCGSTFSVCLPLTQPITQTELNIARPRSERGRRLLIVDDNVGAAATLAQVLQKSGGHRVETAYDGPSALKKIQQWHPEIVLLDIGIPGMDGFQVAQALRQQPEFDDVALIALTGYGREEDLRRSREVGINRHLVKPVAVHDLEELLAGLAEPTRSDPNERHDGSTA